ncbi:DUF3785 domain-containing protein [Clostridium sediminicola]|uniref:DUF3785 family protein n=1 Tax=Clostridium sediminicola TaxID=3114879 RepID=UPI0031F255C2
MYKFVFNDKEYELKEENCECFINDEENPVNGFELSDAMELLNGAKNINFDLEYFGEPCENCYEGKKEKTYKYLEYHFYIFSKEGTYVTSSISSEYENTSFNKLLKAEKVDNSYIVSIIVCENCGEFSIEIEECGV